MKDRFMFVIGIDIDNISFAEIFDDFNSALNYVEKNCFFIKEWKIADYCCGKMSVWAEFKWAEFKGDEKN